MGERKTETILSPGFVQAMWPVPGESLVMRYVQMEHYSIHLKEFVICRKMSSAHKTKK